MRCALAVVLLLGGLLSVSPASAAGPAFGFSLTLPGAPPMEPPPRLGAHPEFRPVCLSDDDVTAELEDAGWRHVEIGDRLGHFGVVAYGRWHRTPTLYQMTVDRCSGSVRHVAPVEYDNLPSGGDYGPPSSNGGRDTGYGTGD